MRFILRSLVVQFLLAGAAVASGWGPFADVVQATDRESGYYLVGEGNSWTLGRLNGPSRQLELPARFIAYRIEPLDDGWVATGSLPRPYGRDLLILRGVGDRIEVMPQPSQRFGIVRRNPVPLVRDGVLEGIAWIEGDRQDEFVVRAAQWNGSDWGNSEEVSPPRGGAQMALAGSVLGNGEWLLLWAGWDGEDDEILWSRRGEVWSTPARVHADNQSPDITPAVVTTDDGALAAWSVLHEGDYRLRIARLGIDGWEVEAPSGGMGSVFPRLFRSRLGIEVLHQSVIPEGWSVVQLDTVGREAGRLHVPQVGNDAPLMMSSDALGAEIAWPRWQHVGELDRRRSEWEER